jgi:hypothetical protein
MFREGSVSLVPTTAMCGYPLEVQVYFYSLLVINNFCFLADILIGHTILVFVLPEDYMVVFLYLAVGNMFYYKWLRRKGL